MDADKTAGPQNGARPEPGAVMTDTRQENFMSGLQALLKKNDAEMEAIDNSVLDPVAFPSCVISFRYDPYRPHFEFELPKYLGPNGE